MVDCVIVKPDMLKALDTKLNRWMVMDAQAVCREDRRKPWAAFDGSRFPTRVERQSCGDPGWPGPPEGVTPMAAKKKAKKKAAKKKK
jgi:hypothetical protein